MNEQAFFILTRPSGGQWKDNTASITSVRPDGKKCHVLFFSGKSCPYNAENVQFFDNPIAIENTPAIVRFKQEEIYCEFALRFGPYICVYYKDSSCNHPEKYKKRWDEASQLVFLPNIADQANAKRLAEYFHYLSQRTGEKPKHIPHYYQTKLNVIHPESVTSAYLTKKPLARPKPNLVPIFPFGINPSQREALNHALENQVSIIQGPPGTGKTQTILNIIANLVRQNKTVAIVAGNNSAVANVYEKLEKAGVGFIAATLGNGELVEQFVQDMPCIADISSWKMPQQRLNTTLKALKENNQLIVELLESKNQLAKTLEAISRLKVEKSYFDRHFSAEPLNLHRWSVFNKWSAPHLARFIADFSAQADKPSLSFRSKFVWLFKYGIYRFTDLQNLDGQTYKRLFAEYYRTKEVELQQTKTDLEKKLSSHDFDNLLGRYTAHSLWLFKHQLSQQFKPGDSVAVNKYSYKQEFFAEFQRRFPVVLSTTDSIINNKNEAALFDYLIVDEASQVNLLTGYLALSCAKNAVIVGDLAQLPHIEDKAIAEIHREAERQYSVWPPYNYLKESLLSSMCKVFVDKVPVTLLKEHYRCHPRIIDFCNQKFYDGKLITMTKAKTDPFIIIKTAPGNHARAANKKGSGCINERELDVIKHEVLPVELAQCSADELGVISPYRAQADKAVGHLQTEGLLVDTVHRFQGREKDTIVFGTTANKLNDFIDKPNLLNVAVSRAKNRFIMITSQNTFKAQGSNIGDLIRHIEYQSMSPAIFESEVISVFDCLYQDYSPHLNGFLRKVKRHSKYLSEDIMAQLLDEQLRHNQFNSFNYVRNYPLGWVVRDLNRLDQTQRQFAENPGSHIDFLVFNKLDKQPLLAIEVDGYQYHELSEIQKHRDKIKNSILAKMDIPITRFSTISSQQKAMLKAALTNVLEHVPTESE